MFRIALRRPVFLSYRTTYIPRHTLHLTRPLALQFSSTSSSSNSPANKSCPNCSKPLPTALPACTNCWTIRRLPSSTLYHEVFGLPYEPNPFDVDLTVLKRRFREAQGICHPDSWASKGSDKQDLAQELSSRINEAYQGLLNPLSRLEYILSRNGHPISETDRLDNTDFILQVMEHREGIENSVDAEEVTQILEESELLMTEKLLEAKRWVESKNWKKVKEAAIYIRYLIGVERAGKAWRDAHL